MFKRFNTLLIAAILGCALANNTQAQDFSRLSLVPIASGLLQPIGFVAPGDGSGRMFIIEQAGVIRIFDLSTNTVKTTPFLDIQNIIDSSQNEQGLLGLAFHPDFESNGQFYVNYTRDPGAAPDRTVIAQYSISANPDVASTQETRLLEFEQNASNHNGGDLQFGPDGYLYISSGDGGGSNDQFDNAQDITTLKGALLRIDVDSTPAIDDVLCGLVQNYGIPAGNPFADAAGCDEIWAFGLRNPWRFSFDRETGELFIGDVGQNQWEEVDFLPANTPGVNFGWSCREGAHDFPDGNACVGAIEEPILEYNHTLGCSITGGFRYRGLVPEFDEFYFYGDFCSDRIWLAKDDGGWSTAEWTAAAGVLQSIASFGQDELGNLYVADRSGGIIYRIEIENTVFGDGFEIPD